MPSDQAPSIVTRRGLWLTAAVAACVAVIVVVMGITTLLATLLHASEAVIWAAAYHELHALPNIHEALLYSLSALTTYGHAELYLAPHWRLMGALEALNGLLLFGLTTAFLYGQAQRVWPLDGREAFPPAS